METVRFPHTEGRCFIKSNVHQFDHTFSGMNPREVVSLDPAERTFLEVVKEGFESDAVRLGNLTGSSAGRTETSATIISSCNIVTPDISSHTRSLRGRHDPEQSGQSHLRFQAAEPDARYRALELHVRSSPGLFRDPDRRMLQGNPDT